MYLLTDKEILNLTTEEFEAYESWAADFVDNNNTQIQNHIEVMGKAGKDFDYENYFAFRQK